MIVTTGRGTSFNIIEHEPQNYPSCRIQKGIVLVHGNRDLSEEGVGFGVPLIKFGHKIIFPGSGHITLKKDRTFVKIDYDLNLAERMLVKGRKIESKTFYELKELLSRLHREHPFSREMLKKGSIAIRRALSLETRFQEIVSAGQVSVEYSISADGMIHVSADLSRVKKDGCTEVMIMNEQGANHFDTYCDSNGTILAGNTIGSWQETHSDEVSFIDSLHDLAFILSRVSGSRMFYGRELVGNRLGWSGLAYSLTPHKQYFAYDIRIGSGQ
jgi:hypothetical protein